MAARFCIKPAGRQECIWHGLEIIKRQMDYQKTRQDYPRFKTKCESLSASLEDKKASYRSTLEKLHPMKSDLALLEEEYLAKEKVLKDIRDMFKKKTNSKVTERLKVIKRRYRTKYPKVISFLTDNPAGLNHKPRCAGLATTSDFEYRRR